MFRVTFPRVRSTVADGTMGEARIGLVCGVFLVAVLASAAAAAAAGSGVRHIDSAAAGGVRVAAYAADEAVVGTPDSAWSLLNTALARGDLDQGYGGAHGNKYIASVHRFLAANRYG